MNRAISTSSSVYCLNQRAIPAWSRAAILISFSCLLIPRGVELQLGTIMVDSSRVVLTLFSIIALMQLFSGPIKIRTTVADFFMFMHIGIIAFSAIYHGGFGEGLENAIAVLVDMGLAYFVARVAVHNLQCYRYCVRIILIIAVISAVFGLVEMLTGYSVIRAVYHTFFSRVMYVHLTVQRLSLFRAYATFATDILLGLYCMIAFALAIYVKPSHLQMGRKLYRVCLILCVLGVFASLSSGPWIALCLCFFCLVYDRIMRSIAGRWKLLLLSIGSMLLFLSIVSNRGPIKLIIDYLTIDPWTGYVRLMMWESVLALMPTYWLLGWGWGNDWPRSEDYIWSSIDSYYAVYLVTSGVFAVLSIVGFLVCSWRRLSSPARVRYLSSGEAKGWILATVCLFFGAITVHIFGNLTFAVYFLLGAGQTLAVGYESK